MKLTKDAIAKLTLPDGKTDHIVWDDSLPGFGVRLRGDSKRWVVQYRFGDQQRRESLGDIRQVSLDAARNIARTRFAQIQLGTDPGAEKAKAREAAHAAALSLANIAARYIDAKADVLRPSSYASIKRHLTVFWAPLSDRAIGEIKRAEVAARLQEITKGRGRIASARGRSTLSSLFGWAMREGLCEANPVIGTNDPTQGIESRDRVLTDVELVKVWNACREDDFGRIVKLLILTGCRRDEIGSLKWSEIDGNVLTIPAARSKNRKVHSLTLPAMALDILAAISHREGRDYVFGLSGQGFQRYSFCTNQLRSRLGEMPEFTLHDLRRTFRTGLGRLGVPSHVAELAINHVRTGIEGVYDRHRYQGEIASALAQWAAHVAAIIEGRQGSNISPLRQA
jgi:integrase